jgi:ribosomal-protein-alanine N-acetyltransferase
MRTIETAALTLEPQLARHADEMFEVLSDPAIYEYENQAPASLDALRRRYAALESRRSPDGVDQWLNWVIRLPHGEAIGYVQATVWPDGRAAIAYELGSAWWGRGLARRAVEAMVDELVAQHDVQRLSAVLKRANLRSRRLLERLGFELASQDEQRRRGVDADELLMERAARTALPAHPPSASDRLRALARRVAAAHVVAGAPPPMALVSGSTVDDIADARSDVDMSAVYESLPPGADLRAACAAAGGLPWFWQAGNLADGSLVVAFKLEGVEVQIGYSDFATLEREIDEVVVRHNPDTPLHKLAEGLLKAEPLLDADRLRSLQAKVAVFPPALGRAMAQHFIGRVTPWRAIAQLLHRDAALWCRELQVEACYKLIGALAGLNGVYFTTFQFKRMTRFAANLKRAPADFSSRIDALLQAETGAAFDALHALEGEVVELLGEQWSDLDLAAVRERRAAYAPGGVG